MSAVPRSRAPGAPRSRPASNVRRRRAEPTLHEAEVAQGDRAAEDVGEEPGVRQPRDGLGVGRVGARESPVAQAASPPSAPAPARDQVVVRRGEGQRRAGVRHGGVQVAVVQRQRRPVHLDGRGERAVAVLVHHDQAGRRLLAARRRRPGAAPPRCRRAAARRWRSPTPARACRRTPWPAPGGTAPRRRAARATSGPARPRAAPAASPAMASSIRSAARSGSSPARACRMASTVSPCASTSRWPAGAARRPRRAARRAGARAGRRRTGGGSGTTGGGRRAGRGRGSPGRGRRAARRPRSAR